MNKKILSVIFTTVLVLLISENAYAESDYDEKLGFAKALEETLGHFWAIEQNVDAGNAELSLVHATHPIAELYDSIKPMLKQHDAVLDEKLQKALINLPVTIELNPNDAKATITELQDLVDQSRTTVVGDELYSDVSFQLDLIKGLLATTKVEYAEAVSNGEIHELAEFQDGSAFVWKSEQIFDRVSTELSPQESKEIKEHYKELVDAFELKQDPEDIDGIIDGITGKINKIQGTEEEVENLLNYVDNIEKLLADVKTEYRKGNIDIAQSFATKAYLDNFEYIENPLKDTGNSELVHEIEQLLREDLRGMIKEGAPSAEIDQKVDTILEKMESVKVAIPEFGTLVMVAMAIAIVGIILVTSKRTATSRFGLILRQ